MERFPPTVTLIDACRSLLRAMCPDQPALADKIPTRSGWELSYPKYDITLPKRVRRLIRRKVKTAKKEMAKLKEARELLAELIGKKSSGFVGRSTLGNRWRILIRLMPRSAW